MGVERIVLIGYRGSGKSTVGRILAERLGWRFLDTDDLIEQAANMTIAEIFAAHGEQHFRDLEAAVIAEVCRLSRVVIGAGGGAILRNENVDNMRRDALVVWLTASPETLYARIVSDEKTAARRPQLTAHQGIDEVRHLLKVREPLYRKAAHMQIDTENLQPQQVAETILRAARDGLAAANQDAAETTPD